PPCTLQPLPRPPLFPSTTLFRSLRSRQQIPQLAERVSLDSRDVHLREADFVGHLLLAAALVKAAAENEPLARGLQPAGGGRRNRDRKSTRLNSSHVKSSYAVFCL